MSISIPTPEHAQNAARQELALRGVTGPVRLLKEARPNRWLSSLEVGAYYVSILEYPDDFDVYLAVEQPKTEKMRCVKCTVEKETGDVYFTPDPFHRISLQLF